VSQEARDRIRQTRVALPPPGNALVAAAARLTQRAPTAPVPNVPPTDEWQTRLWSMYRSVGELRFGVGWLSNALSRVNLIPAKPPANPGDEPQALDVGTVDKPGPDWALKTAADMVTSIAGGPVGQGQLLAGTTVHMMLPGICYVLAEVDEATDLFSTWSVLSQSEVRVQPNSDPPVYERRLDHTAWQVIPENQLLIKVWRQDREFSWLPDSPARSVLDTLDEIKLCTDHIRSTAMSRLMSAGVVVFPSGVEFPTPPKSPSDDPDVPEVGRLEGFVDTLIEVSRVAIADRDSPAAHVPIPVTIPAEEAQSGLPKLLSFETAFDHMVLDIRAAAINRLALGIELPPEVLNGLGDVNHWSAWQVEESAITLQIEPMAEILCHALTTMYLKPALQEAGLEPDAVIVWHDTTDLRVRPDRSASAVEAFDRFWLSAQAMLREMGLSEDDMPDDVERRERLLWAIALSNGPLAVQALNQLGFTFTEPAAAPGGPPPPPASPDSPPSGSQGPPVRTPPPPPANTTNEALLAACDGVVERALEKAGSKLRSALGRKHGGGPQAIPCPDPATLHTHVDVTAAGVSLNALLDGAWDRCGVIAHRYGVDEAQLCAQLDTYTRALLASRHAHDYDRLARALDLQSAG
jgi:hypothetical protein